MSTFRATSGPRTDRVIQWLLDGDPAIRWQTLRDLAGAEERAVEQEQRKVALDGWGARLLAKQDPVATLIQREDLFRAGTPRRAEPLEYSARTARAEVVGWRERAARTLGQ
jgi:hypothetical protein